MESGLHKKKHIQVHADLNTRTATYMCAYTYVHLHRHVPFHICSCTLMSTSSSHHSLGFAGMGPFVSLWVDKLPQEGVTLLCSWSTLSATVPESPDCSGPTVGSFCSKLVKSLRPSMHAVSCADFWLILSSVDE